MVAPTYKVLIDWDVDGGLRLGDFEFDLDGWVVGGTVPPTFERSGFRSYHGSVSGLITWGAGGTLPHIGRAVSNLTAGVQYTLSAWVYVPAGSIDLLWAVAGVSTGAASVTTDAWTQITHTFTATAATHSLQIQPETSPAGGEQAWVDHMRITGPGEDVSSRVHERSTIGIEYGRDQARSLAPPRPGAADFELDNTSRDYSPENASSPLANNLGPGRQTVIEATHGSKVYTLYQGFTDEFDLKPDPGDWSATFSALDGLGRLRDIKISTALHLSLSTGQAIHAILDAAGWTAARDIDYGACTIRHWWEEGTDAFTALKKVVDTEGLPAVAYIGPSGEFVFRDRHHRLIRAASTAVQATFRDSGAEPLFLDDMGYDIGWRDIVNSVELKVTEREADTDTAVDVYSDNLIRQIAGGDTHVVNVRADEPFIAARVPQAGDDFTLLSGAVTVTLSRLGGQSLEIRITASTAAAIQGLRLPGFKVATARTVVVRAEDSTSIAKHGRRSYTGQDAAWLTRNDAEAIAAVILSQRATRLPVVRIRLTGINDTALTQQLSRRLSDRVRIIDAETGLDGPFYIEQIKHAITETGLMLETEFGCEKVPTAPATTLFQFDVAGHGFNDGKFGQTGLDDPATVFIFDHATQGQFDVGLFAN